MKLPSFFILLLLYSLLSQSLHCCCQQVYLNNSVYNCTFNLTTKTGYVCNGLHQSCTSFVAFRSEPLHDTTQSIANLLGSEASSIASINNISSSDNIIIPSNQTVIVPVYCSCSGNIYQHATPYDMKKGDYYFKLANETYQGLASCQMLVRQNYYLPENISVGAQVTVPVLCACPTAEQISDGVSFLLVHTLDYDDSIESVAEAYGVDQHSLLSANELPSNATVSPSTPLLVPLKPSSCKLNSHIFYCTCSFSQLYLSNSSVNNLYCDHVQTNAHHFPVRLVVSLGNLSSILPR